MKLPRIFHTLLLTALLSVLIDNTNFAFAEQLLFQRGPTLYAAEMDGTEARPLFDLAPAGDAAAASTVWSAAPDGRRVVWMRRGDLAPGVAGDAVNLRDRSAQLFLSDLTGRRQKLLFSTTTLHDRQNKRVTSVGINLLGTPEEIPVRKFESWEPVSLAWSADSRTVYVSCNCLLSTLALKATFAVDAATGAALVDADGRWKTVAPMTDVHASGVLIVGSGSGTAQKGASAPPTRYTPLYLINLAAGTRAPLFDAATQDAATLPDYAFARTPSLSGNDNRYIAFASANKGLWLLDRTTQQYRPLLERNVIRPRWAAEATSLFFMEARPAAQAGRISYDLYAADFVPSTGQLGLPRPLLQGIESFDVVPD